MASASRKPSRPRETLGPDDVEERALQPRLGQLVPHRGRARAACSSVGDLQPRPASCQTTSTSATATTGGRTFCSSTCAQRACGGLHRVQCVEARLRGRRDPVGPCRARLPAARRLVRRVVSVLAMAADLPTQFFGDLDGQLRHGGVLDTARLRDVDRPLAGDPARAGRTAARRAAPAAPPRARCA